MNFKKFLKTNRINDLEESAKTKSLNDLQIDEVVDMVIDEDIEIELLEPLINEMAINDTQIKMREQIKHRIEGFAKQCASGNDSACKNVTQLRDRLKQLKLA